VSFTLWHHPYSAYGQKASIAAYELDLPFTLKIVDHADPELMAEFTRLSPFAKMPVLVDADGRVFTESSIVVEWMDRHAGGGRLIPADPDAALEARYMDRVLDFYVGGPMNRIVFNRLGRAGTPDPVALQQDEELLATAWDMLEDRLADGRAWGAGATFTLADCGAAPLMTYARRLVPFGERPRLRAWHQRLTARPSFQRALEDAAPYGNLMPAPPAED
jgi:glutathione S-transferase